MNQAPVTYLLKDAIGVIRIDNPPVNALSQAVRAGLMAALAQAAADQSRALLVVCAGRTFIAGADITEFGKAPLEPALPEVIAALENFPKPVLAALHGTALGGGLEVAMAAHYRCALADTRLGLPEVNLGLLPGAGGTQRLPRLVGCKTALDMMTSGKPVDAGAALASGLLDRILACDKPGEELEDCALAYAGELLAAGAGVRPTGQREINETLPDDFFASYRAGMARKSRGLIAPGFIVELVEMAGRSSIDQGQTQERERFLECRNSPQSAALRHVFFAERATRKLPDRPAATPLREVASVAVIGAGTMGGGIAMCFANAGIPVTVVDTDEQGLERGLQVVRNNYAQSVKRGRFSEQQVESFLARVKGTTDYAEIAAVDLVVEAVFENMEIKKTVFRMLDASCKPGCILATNTSYLDVNEIAGVTSRPGDVIGAHFFSPANVMKLLEVVRAAATAPEVVNTFMQVAKKIGKIPVAVRVCHGFVGNRMLKAYARQAQLLLLEGASPQQVDGVMENWGLAMGPLAVGDLAGLDIGYRSRRDQDIESRSLKEFALADTLVEMERLGQKSGAGYYRYDPATRKRENDAQVQALIVKIASQFGVTRRNIDDQEILDRLLLALVNEGADILSEGIAARPGDIDIVYLNGYGFPRWRGGPMYHADTLGLEVVLDKLQTLRERSGDSCWEAAALLRELAGAGVPLASLN